MFKLVALIFAVANGVPSETPVTILRYGENFETLEACSEFAESEKGLVVRKSLRDLLESKGVPLAAKVGCAKEEDSTI